MPHRTAHQADCLQAGVRVRRDVHTAGFGNIVRTVVVDKAPGADEWTLTLRERTPNRHGARTAEPHFAKADDLNGGTIALRTFPAGQNPRAADKFTGIFLDVAHGTPNLLKLEELSAKPNTPLTRPRNQR